MGALRRSSRTTRGILLGTLLIAAICGCTEPMEIRSAYGPDVSLSGLGATFDWLPRTRQSAGDYRAENPELHALIRSFMESEFAAKGYEKRSAETPDLWLDYHVGRRRTGKAVGAHPYVEYEEGALIIDIVSPKTKKLIWRGSAQAKLNKTDPPSARRAKIAQAVQGILKRFPSKDKQ